MGQTAQRKDQKKMIYKPDLKKKSWQMILFQRLFIHYDFGNFGKKDRYPAQEKSLSVVNDKLFFVAFCPYSKYQTPSLSWLQLALSHILLRPTAFNFSCCFIII